MEFTMEMLVTIIGTVSMLVALVVAVSRPISGLRGDMKELEAKIEKLDDKVNALTSRVDVLDGRVSMVIDLAMAAQRLPLIPQI
jgi:outer membrane murein-binding lipoprotein Lpp